MPRLKGESLISFHAGVVVRFEPPRQPPLAAVSPSLSKEGRLPMPQLGKRHRFEPPRQPSLARCQLLLIQRGVPMPQLGKRHRFEPPRQPPLAAVSPSLSKEGSRAFFILYGAARGMRGSRKTCLNLQFSFLVR